MKKVLKASSLLGLSRASWATLSEGTRMLRYAKQGVSPREAKFEESVRRWGQRLCSAFNVSVTVSGESTLREPGLLLGNHMSYIDIPVICSVDPVSFVGKSETRSYPVFGPAAEAFGAIFIDRKSEESRKATAQKLSYVITEQERRVIVFVEGTTSLRGLDWKPGAFRLAHESNLPIQPFCIYYTPADKLAFEEDSMMEHALRLNKLGPIQAHIHFGPVLKSTSPVEDAKKWDEWNKQILHDALKKQNLLM